MATNTVLSKLTSTELEAVNEMLGAVDLVPVANITGNLDIEVGSAVSRLSNVNRTVQSMGWDFNTRKKVKYLRDVNNEVTIGTNVLKIVPVGNSRSKHLVLREGRIFDRDEDSFTLLDDVWLDIIELLNFEDLPQTCREYITARAVRAHERFESADDTKTEIAGKQEQDAWSILINDHSIANQETMEDNSSVFSSIFGRE